MQWYITKKRFVALCNCVWSWLAVWNRILHSNLTKQNVENGLDPETSLHLYQIYVLPVLLYGMEVVFPRPKYIEVLEKFNKHNLKHIMSLPVTTADPAVYILSGNLPIEAMIHQRVLNFFGNISRLPDSTVERQLSVRQLTVKTSDSNSWFIAVRKLCIMYGLPDIIISYHNLIFD